MFAQELGHRRANAISLNREGGKPVRTGASREFGKLVYLTPRVVGTAWDSGDPDQAAHRQRLSERAESCLAQGIGYVTHLKTEVKIRAVTAKPIDGFSVCESWKRRHENALRGEPLGQADVKLLD